MYYSLKDYQNVEIPPFFILPEEVLNSIANLDRLQKQIQKRSRAIFSISQVECLQMPLQNSENQELLLNGQNDSKKS